MGRMLALFGLFGRRDSGPAGDMLALRGAISAIGICAVMATTLIPPTAFLSFGYYYERDTARTIASRLAGWFERRSSSESNFTWKNFGAIAQLQQAQGPFGRQYRQSLVASDGEVLLANSINLPGPTLVVRIPTTLRGEAFGHIEIIATLRPLLTTTALIALVSSLLGFAVWQLVHRFPLSVLDRTLGALRKNTGLLDAALNNMAHGLCMVDADQRLVICNSRYSGMYSLPEALTRPGTRMCDILDFRIAQGFYAGTDPAEFRRVARAAVVANLAHATVHELNDGRVIAVSHQPLAGGGGVMTHNDITEQRQVLSQMQFLTEHDVLTGLSNRAHLRQELAKALDGPSDQKIAALCIDLGRFKDLNDTYGRQTSDAMLKQAANRLRVCNHATGVPGIIARKEGDRFVVLQRASNQPATATRVAIRIVEALSAPYQIDGHHHMMDPKVGIAVSPADGNAPDQLLANATIALHRARVDEQSAYQFFEASMDAEIKARRALELDFSDALRNGELRIHYQPLVNLDRGQIGGCEALLRWKHPRRGWVSPVEFIPVAEASGLIAPIGDWVLRQACADATTWPAHVKVAVNISAVQFKIGRLVESVSDALKASGLAPERLELEITESVLLADSDATLKTLHQLKRLGLRISMDDFGTGYSSLSYLRSFPFDKIKIDRCFIKDLSTHDPNSRAIMRAVARLGTSFGIATLAEGIETAEQLEMVRAEGCLEGQGYLFSRPIASTDIGKLLWQQAQVIVESQPDETGLPCVPVLSVRSTGDLGTEREEERLQALYAYNVLDTAPEEAFDRITRLARLALQAPMAMVSLVDRDRQWFKSRQGVAADETPRHFSFCTHTIKQDRPLVVPDASLDPRFNNSPLVTGGQNIRAYVGVPLRTPDGHNIGALCINDIVPREVTHEQIEVLQDLARLAVDELELRKLACIDSTTGVMTARAFNRQANIRLAQTRVKQGNASCIVFDIDGLKSINDSEGHGAGDRALGVAAALCAAHLQPDDYIARLRSDEFAVLLADATLGRAGHIAESMRTSMEDQSGRLGQQLTAKFGVAAFRPEDSDISDVIARAALGLKTARTRGGNCVEIFGLADGLPSQAA